MMPERPSMMKARFMKLRHSPLILAIGCSLLLAGCGKDQTEASGTGDEDPALTSALGDQIMVDPDLAGQNRGNAAISGGGPASGAIPPQLKTPEAIAAAKADAAKLVGGPLQTAPAVSKESEATPANATAADLALSIPGSGSQCADKVDYTAAWATKLPAALPVYPRGHVQEAAGTDKDGCHLRVVNFVTPVGVQDVLDFYYTRARAAGYDAGHTTEGKDGAMHLLGGSKGASAYVVYVQAKADGLTEVDIVANGQ